MSVTRANGNVTESGKDVGDTVGELSAKAKGRAANLAEQTKDVAKRRPVPLVTAAAAAATATAAVVTVMRRRRTRRTPMQRAADAWRRAGKTVRKRVKR